MMSEELAASQFAIEIDHAPDATVVRCRGKLTAGAQDFLYTEVRQLMADSTRIVLDLTDLTHMDSMGLGAVVRLYVSARSAGTDFEIINIGKRIRQMLGVTGLLSVFTAVGEHGIRMP
jgi:anti-sigma B factor antagonist